MKRYKRRHQATRTAIVVLEMQSIAGRPAEGSMPMTTSPQ